MFSQIFDAIEEWMRELLTGMITSNLDTMFNKDSVNDDKQEVRLGKMNMPEREVVELLSNGDVELKISKE